MFFANRYQLPFLSDIPEKKWTEAAIKDEDGTTHTRMDIIWGYLAKVKLPGGKQKFGLFSRAAKLVLVIPHSNAGEKRVFSMVRKNKTDFRSSLSLDGTLTSLPSSWPLQNPPLLATNGSHLRMSSQG